MSKFRIGIGHDSDPIDVEFFVPYQPKTPGLRWTRVTSTVAGTVKEGPYIPFTFDILTEDEFRAVMAQAGLTVGGIPQDRADVTLYAQDEDYNWQYFNGVAHRPSEFARERVHLMKVPLLITDIHLATLP